MGNCFSSGGGAAAGAMPKHEGINGGDLGGGAHLDNHTTATATATTPLWVRRQTSWSTRCNIRFSTRTLTDP